MILKKRIKLEAYFQNNNMLNGWTRGIYIFFERFFNDINEMYICLKKASTLQGFLDQNLYNIIKEWNIYSNVKIT